MKKETYKRLSSLADIPQENYEGYIWYSDKSTAEVLHQTSFDFSQVKDNPFIIEGFLYSQKKMLSISIKNIDGDYLISQVQIPKTLNKSEGELIPHTYLATSGIQGVEKLHFKELWEPVKDELCENMETLKPGWTAFIGFTLKGET